MTDITRHLGGVALAGNLSQMLDHVAPELGGLGQAVTFCSRSATALRF
jgi:hypothetical protein